jgi:hypothetical protein
MQVVCFLSTWKVQLHFHAQGGTPLRAPEVVIWCAYGLSWVNVACGYAGRNLSKTMVAVKCVSAADAMIAARVRVCITQHGDLCIVALATWRGGGEGARGMT